MDRLVNGQIIEGEVSDLGMNGEGVLKYGDSVVFAPYALPGEIVRARITHAKKGIAFADVIEVLSASNDRVKPVCPYYKRCGGCDLQHLSAQAQLEIKRKNIAGQLYKNAGINYHVPLPVRLNDWNYRNKLSMPFGKNPRSGRVYLGFYEKNSHVVVPVKWCPLSGEWAAELIGTVTDWANGHDISVYDEQTGKGLLRHLAARKLDGLSVTLVINGTQVPEVEKLTAALEKKFHDLAVYISINQARSNVIMGDTVKPIGGKETPQTLGRFKAVISPLSFFQVNDEVRDALYAEVLKHLNGFSGEIVELYSGVGLLTAELLTALPDVKITAVEIVPKAVSDAKDLFKSLGISDRVKAVCADAADYLMNYCENSGNSVEERIPRILILDPPRKGVDKRVINAAKQAGFDRIIYISCNPSTLSRDLKLLMSDNDSGISDFADKSAPTDCADKTDKNAFGYKIDCVIPFDMFPQTSHVETLVCLSRHE